ncbi:MAG: hypothetical protein NZM12_06465, partial [Steroidobacteraceae bacterium]|nr:hypothetical protein [Steroidobacteraceae bacterium]
MVPLSRSRGVGGFLTAMRLEFVKMHGLGNDFLLIDLPTTGTLPTSAEWRALADRRTGIGFDQALVIGPPRAAE